MQLILILLSFWEGLTGITSVSPIHNLLFPETFMHVLMDTGFSFYNEILIIDTLNYTWTINPNIDTLKVPLLDVMSIKHKDSASYIGLSYASPIMDTFHTVFLSYNTEAINHRFTKQNYLIGGQTGSKTSHLKLALFHRRPSCYTSYLNTKISRMGFSVNGALSFHRMAYINAYIYRSLSYFNAGVFGIYTQKSTVLGPLLGVKTKNINVTLKIPIKNFARMPVLGNINLLYRHFVFLTLSEMLYDFKKDTIVHLFLCKALYTSKIFNGDIYYKKLSHSQTYGGDFSIHLNQYLRVGVFLQNRDTAFYMIPFLGLSHSLYSGELVTQLLMAYNDLKYLYYGVEFSLFRNLIIRVRKNKYGDFIGIFVRLLN